MVNQHPTVGLTPPFSGLRPTRQRLAVLDAVDSLGVFASAQTVHRVLIEGGESVGLSTVYRSLHRLAEYGTLDSVRGPDGEELYRRCANPAGHVHLVCRGCGAAAEFPAGEIEILVARWAANAGYSDSSHSLELFGLCPDCQE